MDADSRARFTESPLSRAAAHDSSQPLCTSPPMPQNRPLPNNSQRQQHPAAASATHPARSLKGAEKDIGTQLPLPRAAQGGGLGPGSPAWEQSRPPFPSCFPRQVGSEAPGLVSGHGGPAVAPSPPRWALSPPSPGFVKSPFVRSFIHSASPQLLSVYYAPVAGDGSMRTHSWDTWPGEPAPAAQWEP